MKPTVIHDTLSWSSIQIKTMLNDQDFTTATGFFYSLYNRSFLITNYHVVSGKEPNGTTLTHRSAHIPDTLALKIPENTNHTLNSELLTQWVWRKLPLYSEGDLSKPIWFEHPKHGSNFDVVAIPLNITDESLIKTANSQIHNFDDFEIYPSLDAFVLGYPFGTRGGNFPIWKRATIATEPDIDIDGMPKLFIDTATREGMSGAPVFAQEVGYWQSKGVTDLSKAHLGKGRKFLGVYSGRIGAENSFKSQLGVVWKEQALIELLLDIPAQSDSSDPAN